MPQPLKPLNKIKLESEKIKQEAQKQILTYIIAAFALIAGLAWNEAIKSLIEYFFPTNGAGVWFKMIYALLITLTAVIVTLALSRLLKKKK